MRSSAFKAQESAKILSGRENWRHIPAQIQQRTIQFEGNTNSQLLWRSKEFDPPSRSLILQMLGSSPASNFTWLLGGLGFPISWDYRNEGQLWIWYLYLLWSSCLMKSELILCFQMYESDVHLDLHLFPLCLRNWLLTNPVLRADETKFAFLCLGTTES